MAHAPIGFSALILGPHLEISDLTREALRGEGYLSREGQGPASLSAGGDFPQLWCGRLQLTDTLVVSSPSLAPWEGVIFPSGPEQMTMLPSAPPPPSPHRWPHCLSGTQNTHSLPLSPWLLLGLEKVPPSKALRGPLSF